MSAFAPQPFKFYTFAEFLNTEFESKPKEIIWKCGPKGPEDKTPIIQIRSNAMNIISNRKLRSNVRLGVKMGVDLAAAGKSVLYINSYCVPSELRALVESSGPQPKNFGILNTPIGGWDSCADTIDNMIEHRGIDTIILNSFEYAPITHYQKQQMAMQLVRLQQHYQMTIIVFTTEIRKDLAVGMTGRGPIGVLSGHSEMFWRVVEDENGDIRSEKGIVHELSIKKTLSESGARHSKSKKELWPSDYEKEPDSELENALSGILEGASSKMLAELEIC